MLLTLPLLFGCSSNDKEATSPASTTAAPTSTSASSEGGLSAMAAAITDLLVANDWAAVRKDFDDTMLQGLSEERLAEVWTQTVREVGAYRSRGEPVTGPSQGDVVSFDTALHFEHGDRKSRIAFHADGKVAGFFLLLANAR